MLADDNILCCLLPNKCNLYNQSVLFQIFSIVSFGLSFVFVIYTFATSIYSFWLIWNQYIKVKFE